MYLFFYVYFYYFIVKCAINCITFSITLISASMIIKTRSTAIAVRTNISETVYFDATSKSCKLFMKFRKTASA